MHIFSELLNYILFFQDIPGDFHLDIFGWKLDKDQFLIAITCAIAIIILMSITIVFTIWYYCFCKKKTGMLHFIAKLILYFTNFYLLFFVCLVQQSDEEEQRSNSNIPG